MVAMHIGLLFSYSVLLASTVLLIWSFRNKGEGSTLAKVIGSIVFVLSFVSIFSISYCAIKCWSEGKFKTSMSMQDESMQKEMPKMMKNMGMQKKENSPQNNKDQ